MRHRWTEGWKLRTIALYPMNHRLYRLVTPWGFVELHIVPQRK